MINDFFDNIYCVNLDTRTDRWGNAIQEFEKHKLSVERFPAIVGNPTGIQYNMLDGNVGCALSHYNVIKDANDKKYESILVLEDDVIFSDNLQEQFNDMIQYIPSNWDMIYFGGNHNHATLNMINTYVAKIENTYTTHAYAIRSSVYQSVIDLFPKLEFEVDVMYASLQKQFNCYVFRPHLAWQQDGYSDIMKQHTNYEFLKH
jgi:GR25 family glycosyltransferase involved in LPS biosynthesis